MGSAELRLKPLLHCSSEVVQDALYVYRATHVGAIPTLSTNVMSIPFLIPVHR